MKRNIVIAAIFAGTMLTQSIAMGGQIYKWIDSSGRTHYSQFAPESGRTVKILEVQEFYSPPPLEYYDELDRIQRLTQQLAEERQATEQQRSQARVQPYPEVAPLYPTYPLDNIMIEEPLY